MSSERKFRFTGGTASRAEVYGVFIAAVILLGGGGGVAFAYTATDGFSDASSEVSPEESPAFTSSPDDSEASEPEATEAPTLTGPISEPPVSPAPAPTATGAPTQTPGATAPAPTVAPAPNAQADSPYFGAPLPPPVPSKTLVVPDLIGWKMEEVLAWTQANLSANPAWQDTNCYGAMYPPGTVARQSPAPGVTMTTTFNELGHPNWTPQVWMERDTYVGTNWYAAGPCVY